MEFSGSIVAIVTPFKNGKIDEDSLKKLILWHIEQGTNGIVPCGTTGESATLSHEEHSRVIEITVKSANKKIPVIAGTGSNNTEEAVRLTQYAEKVGADAALVISPYYNKPTQRGLFEHFKKVADSVKIPIILYNIASRTCVNIEPETVAELANACKNIAAIKEASGNLEQMTRIRLLCKDKLTLLSGDDGLVLPIMSIGGAGVISVAANIIPREMSNFVSSFRKGDYKKAMEYHYKLFPLIKALFLETNPIPVKWALGRMGLCDPFVRLPLVSMDPKKAEILEAELKKQKLI